MRRFYSADNINFNGVPGDGRGMTIAIVDAYGAPSIWPDLQAFDSYYNLPDPPSFQVMNQFGQLNNLPNPDAPGGWGVESALDVQWAHAMAPLANIVLVEAQSSFTDDLFQGVTTAAGLPNVVCVSMSFGASEFGGESSSDSTFLHTGVTFLAATGDHGTPGTYPAFSPNVVAVGGTAITYNPDGTYVSESAWPGTGGGTSVYEPRPAYQNGIQNSAFRTIPDVSMDAQPSTGVAIYDSYDNGGSTPWGKYGGTSLSTPMFAGLVAIADQGRVSVSQPTLDGATQTLASLYSMSPSTNYHDITTGSSTNGASATVGYDLATGIGTPIANRLVNQLATAGSATPLVTGTPGNNITLTLDTNHLYVDWNNGVTSGQVAVVDLSGLTINGSGGSDTITLNYANGNPLPNLLKLNGTFTLTGLQGTNPLAGSAIDLNQSKLFINYSSGPSLLSAVQQYIANGYNGGAWNGQATASTGVIRSSSAAANPGTAIGYADSADGTGVNTTPDTVELKYTLAGDTNLNGTVDIFDLNNLLPHFNGAGVWTSGDFNYSGSVDIFDLNALLPNFNKSLPLVIPATAGPSTTTTTAAQSSNLPTSRANWNLAALANTLSSPTDWSANHFKKSLKKPLF
jgi:subtilase family serine protease